MPGVLHPDPVTLTGCPNEVHQAGDQPVAGESAQQGIAAREMVARAEWQVVDDGADEDVGPVDRAPRALQMPVERIPARGQVIEFFAVGVAGVEGQALGKSPVESDLQ